MAAMTQRRTALTDLHMAGLTCDETCRDLRRTDTHTHKLVLQPNGTAPARAASRARGAAFFGFRASRPRRFFILYKDIIGHIEL